ncbi:MAG: hypothetical protein GZ091_13985 [Paludibacter sp.]|nr:hypothetical protein [Paludibacter sp.]
MNNNWFEQLKYYYSNFGVSEYTYYIPLGTLALFTLIFAIHLRQFKNKEKKVTDNLNRSAFYASTITTVIYLTTVFVLKRFTEIIAIQQCELICLLVLLVLCLITIFLIVNGKGLFSKTKDHLIVGFPISSRIRIEDLNNLRKQFNRRKFYWLLTLLPFLLLLIAPNTKYLYSIVIDNSLSMENNLIWSVNSFSESLSYSPKEAQYILSYFPMCNNEADCIRKAARLKTNLKKISIVNNPDSLGTTTYSFDNSQNVINAIGQDIQISGIGSPISEAIWQNFLTAKKSTTDFKEKRLIILTDGAENLYYQNQKEVQKIGGSILDSKSKDKISPREFYDKIFFVNQGGDPSMYLFGESDSEILDGSDASSYYISVQSVMSLLTFDLIFVYISLCLVLLTFLVIFLINPHVTN